MKDKRLNIFFLVQNNNLIRHYGFITIFKLFFEKYCLSEF